MEQDSQDSSLYSMATMAEGYARWRPAVHPQVIQRIQQRLRIEARLETALDIGCGSGLSTAALEAIAVRCIGLEPALPMLGFATIAAPHALVAAGRAEQIPVRSGSIDLMAAAGSLNYVDLDHFFPEARRVLRPGGYLVVYDFGPGREFSDSGRLSEWYDEFERRYPFPPCREIDPRALGAGQFDFESSGYEDFAVTLSIRADFYLEYAMTETSVARALQNGIPEAEIRSWCKDTLAPVFDNRVRGIVFRGYIAYFT